MSQELRIWHNARQQYVRALSAAWRRSRTIDPSTWLLREPDLEEKMLLDADIAHVVGYRQHLIAGRQWTCTPADADTDRGQLAAETARKLLGCITDFTGARMRLSRAFFSGSRYASIQLEAKTLSIGDGVERTWWAPTVLHDMDKRRFRFTPVDRMRGDPVVAPRQVWSMATEEWIDQSEAGSIQTIEHVYQDIEGALGYGRGLRDALAWPWYAKEHVFQESLTAAEAHGRGKFMVKIDGLKDSSTGLPNVEVMREWLAMMQESIESGALIFDKDDDIEAMPVAAQGWQLLKDLRDELRRMIFTCVLGANLTTGATEGGSYALAAIQENSTEALIQYDRESLEETLTRDLIGCLWTKNWPNIVELGLSNEGLPRFSITQEKRQDPKERAEVVSVLVAAGLPLSRREVYEQTGFTAPEDGEDVLEPREIPAPGIGGFPGMDSTGFGVR